MTRTTNALLSAALLTAVAGAANAAIIGTTGAVIQIAPPPSAVFGALVGTPASAWDEQQNIVVTGLPVDLSINPSNSGAPTAGLVFGQVNSHFIHWNDFSGIAITGTVSFDGPIAGVAYSNNNLDVSDGVTGALGTVYPTLNPFRGINSTAGANDFVAISGNTISFNMALIPGIPDLNQIRVYTRVIPAPGSLALLGASGLVGFRRRRHA